MRNSNRARIYRTSITENRYHVVFVNPLTKKRSDFRFNDEEEAFEKVNEINWEFFSNNRSFLPPGVTVDSSTKRFRLYVHLNAGEVDNKMKIIKSSKSLDEILKVRDNCIKTLTGMIIE